MQTRPTISSTTTATTPRPRTDMETRRNSRGDVLEPREFDPRSYDERQIDPAVPRVVEVPDTIDGRIDVFLNRWQWRGPRDVVRQELVELIESAKMTPPRQKPGRSKQDYGTPPEFLAAVKARLGIAEFAIDLAANEANACASVFYTEDMNALVQAWNCWAGWCWLNPPFAQINPWVKKAYRESRKGARIAMLVPAGVGANWWKQWVHAKACVLLLNGRITFVGETMPYPKDCALLLYGPEVVAQYEIWTWPKQLRKSAAA